MVTDHTKADDELKQPAQSGNMRLPTDVSAEQKQKLDRLQGLTGAAVDPFESQSNTGNNAKNKSLRVEHTAGSVGSSRKGARY